MTSRLLVVFIALVLLTGIATVIFAPHLVTPYRQIWPLVIPLAAVLAIANIARENRRHNEVQGRGAAARALRSPE